MNKTANKCPICGKVDIPDFLEQDVLCPCCGADLSIYRKLHLAKESSLRALPRRWVYLLGTGIAVVIIVLVICGTRAISTREKDLAERDEQIATLTAQRDSLQRATEELRIKAESTKDEEKYYIVRRGDSFCRISKGLYGTEARAPQIAKWNDRALDDWLYPGDTLKIK